MYWPVHQSKLNSSIWLIESDKIPVTVSSQKSSKTIFGQPNRHQADQALGSDLKNFHEKVLRPIERGSVTRLLNAARFHHTVQLYLLVLMIVERLGNGNAQAKRATHRPPPIRTKVTLHKQASSVPLTLISPQSIVSISIVVSNALQ
ncbi:hypothetical protein PGT21_025558 [Puccinia graminis f. sp. tritici]|uniref:Uncharacterized protein n=1 Tax=Puccinia graminis f. sp. tritici TaxID=56615 RepID=A0A5B0NZA1_PUCGR|nr:hypothetical protein PGT21_025558 [Puccinia graminis f. sp. tritici]